MTGDARAALAEVLSRHQRIVTQKGGPCWCGEWPTAAHDETWMGHVADAILAAALPVPAAASEGSDDREALGRLVREVWVQWATEQDAPKASWLVPWEGLSEPDREVDRRIGEALYQRGLAARPVTAGLTEAVQRVVDRMRTRDVDHRHEDEIGHMGVQGRAYFYAGDIYDDYEDLRAALATAVRDES